MLLMDESTSALDPSAEREVMTAIEELRGTRTIIVVAHRMSALQGCDIIYELHQGRIIRAGQWRDFVARPAPRAASGGT